MSLSSRETPVSIPALESLLREEGFEHFGFAELTKPLSIEVYEAWLEKGYQGEMSYLERHLPEKKEPQRLSKRARSAIVVTVNYVPHPEPLATWPLSGSSKVAAYAKGRDYHHFITQRLASVMAKLREQYPGEEFLSFTDSGAVLERDLAHRAGLGWVGKNTCLLSKERGSLFFLAEIYTSLALPVASLLPHDHCGTCTRCLDVCPTGALKSPRELDARKCISYLTIESRKAPPLELREGIGDWLFGCDLCQTVCPWNVKAHGRETLSSLHSEGKDEHSRKELVSDLRFLLTSPNRALERAFAGTPLMRAGGFGLKRNALVVAGNRGLTELEPEIKAMIASMAGGKGSEKLMELAHWALNRLAK